MKIEKVRVMPGASLVTVGEGQDAQSALFGIPASTLKVLNQRRLPIPRVFVLPEAFFSEGVVQVGAEFFVYFDMFVRGMAFRPVAPEERMVLVGTEDQLCRMRRILEVTLTGFTVDEMRRWKGPQTPRGQRQALSRRELAMLRRYRAWFAPKEPGFAELREFVTQANAHAAHLDLPLSDYPTILHLGTAHPLVEAFLAAHGAVRPGSEAMCLAYEFAIRPLDAFIEFRAYDADGRAALLPGASVVRKGDGTFAVVADDQPPVLVDVHVTEDQAPYLVTLSPTTQAVAPDALTVVCLGSDSGFEAEHPTTGFAICVNGQWVVVDAPVCASHLLRQHGINVEDVRVILETHAHEDHMGSSAHFLLERLATGRPFTYVAAEPVFRAAAAKIAAYRGESEDRVVRELESRGAIRVRPGAPIRLLGATWRFAWTVHPIPTTGFRLSLTHGGQTYAIAYSSDTNRRDGFAGTDAMRVAGCYDPADDPMTALVHGDEGLVFWEAGGTNGDPIHCTVQDRIAVFAERGINPPAVAMHLHPFPPELRHHALARPGDVWTIARQAPVAVADAAATEGVLRSFGDRVRDPEYWLTRFLSDGRVERFVPGATIVAEGSSGDAWYVLLRGEVDVLVSGTRVGTLAKSAFFGELALLGDGKRRATIRAIGPVDVLRISAEAFRDFVVENQLEQFFAEFWTRVGVLQQTRLFVGFPHGVLAALAGHVEERSYAAGEVLIRQGTVGDELFVIRDGEVQVFRSNGTGEEVIGVRGVGEVIGEYGILVPGGQRTATVRASSDTSVYVLSRRDLDRVIAGQLPLELRIVAMVRERGMLVPTSATS